MLRIIEWSEVLDVCSHDDQLLLANVREYVGFVVRVRGKNVVGKLRPEPFLSK